MQKNVRVNSPDMLTTEKIANGIERVLGTRIYIQRDPHEFGAWVARIGKLFLFRRSSRGDVIRALYYAGEELSGAGIYRPRLEKGK